MSVSRTLQRVAFDNLPAGNLFFWPAGQAEPDQKHYLKAVRMPDDATAEAGRDYYFVVLDVERERAAAEAFKHRLGELLRQLRGNERQRHEVALYLGRHHNTIAKWERGEAIPDAWELLRLSRFFNVPVETFYSESAPPLDYSPEENLVREFVLVPEYGVRASAGNGRLVEGEDVVGRLAFRRSWLASRGMRADTLAVVTAHGDSMEPTVRDSDILLVDTSVQSVRVDGIYLIEQAGELRCKRLQSMVDGSVRIRSDNPRYDAEVVGPDHAAMLRVVARVIWIGGER